MDDLIDRQAAIDAHYEYCNKHPDASFPVWSLKILENLPSVQPDSKELSFTQKKLDTISRQATIRWVKTECNPYGKPTLDFESGKKVIEHLKQMPYAQPEHTNSCYINSWCIGCKEYDHERKCCPRYNRVIRQTLDEAYAHGETEAEYRFHKTEKRCDTCRHEKSQWFNRCADCFEYELWEEKT